MEEAPDQRESRSFTRRWQVAWLLVVMVLLAGAYFKHLVEYDNTNARLFTTYSLVERGTWDIDPYRDRTIDLSYNGEHYYSNKAIGLMLLGAPVYSLVRLLEQPPLSLLETWLLQVAGATVPHALAVLVVYLLVLRMGRSRRQAVFCAVAFGFGTFAWQHATLYSSHTLSAALVVISFWLLVRVKEKLQIDKGTQGLSWIMFAAGLLIGWGTLTEYPVAVVALLLLVYVVRLRPGWLPVTSFVLGGAIMAGVLMWYNWAHFGTPFTLSYGQQATGAFSAGSEEGFMGVSLLRPANLFHLVVTPARGLLATCPVLVLMIPGAYYLWQRPGWRGEWWVLVPSVVIFLLWNAAFYGWHSGWAYGSRYQVAILPLAAVLVGFAPRLGWLGWTLLGLSMVQNLLAVAGVPYPPETIRNPLVEFVVPMMGHGYWALNPGQVLGLKGWWSVLPLIVLLGGGLWCLLAWTEDDQDGVDSPAAHWGWRTMAGIWLGLVLLMLAWVRTDPQTVHTLRARLLRDVYVETLHEPFREAGREEYLKAHPAEPE